MKLPLWSIIPAVGLISAFYMVVPSMNYTGTEWCIGNGIIALGIGCIYVGGNIKKKWEDR